MTIVQTRPRQLGSLGPVGPLSFGTWRFTDTDLGAGQALLEAALDHGLNLIDTADVYGFDWGGTGFGQVEEILGAVLRVAPGLRDRMVLATKGGIVPPTPTWGSMVNDGGRMAVRGEWWLLTFSGIALVTTVLAINFLGDGLRDALDPKQTIDRR